MAISSAGIGSGLDVNSIITQLMAIEQEPLLKLDQKEATVQAEISSFGSIKSILSSLQTSLDKLKDTATFQAKNASSSDTDIFTTSADTTAVASSYDVTVNRLAQRHKMASDEFSSATTFGGGAGDELTLTVDGTSFTLDLSTAMTLSEIQAAINVDENTTNITAGIITGDSGNQTLVLTAKDMGYDKRIQLSYGGAITAGTFNLATINTDANNVLIASDAELDASLTVDGVAVTRSSNTISDVVSGLTMTLKSTGSATATIDNNTSSVNGAVTAFVKAFNEAQTTLADLASSSLQGNSIVNNIQTQMRNVFNSKAGVSGSINYAAELGIASVYEIGGTNKGTIASDSDTLTTALEDQLDDVISFFTDETNGFAARMDTMLDGFLKSGGVLDGMVDNANNRIDSIEQSRDSLSRRLVSTEARLRSQYTALDALMSQLTTTSSYLTNQLANLPNLFSKKS
ncbi:flagellar filament capping protein FliD [Sedimenticola sp.]|uniref:flagellar filament capping protein FliD n=1 Tax=Sedimenticola sp. TaxID=1940285 RepID=UPI003D0EAEE7